MIRLPRSRKLDPELRRSDLPFYLQTRWLAGLGAFAVSAQFLSALLAYFRGNGYGTAMEAVERSVGAFALSSSVGYFYARLASRYLGASLLRIRRGEERPLESRLGKWTFGAGLALLAFPAVLSAAASTNLYMAPIYSGAALGMAFSFFLWVSGLPR